jgi:phage/conjugal plasmid C-4 type zinc finger TraR family protein
MSRGFRNADDTQAMSDQALAQQIEKIIDAGRGDAGVATTGGRCHDCGRDIGAERLAALPSATRCVSCQALWEQGPGRR